MRLKRGCRGWWIALLAAAADRVTKAAVRRLWQRPGPSGRGGFSLIPGVIDIRMATNRGAAFSMFSGQAVALTLLTALLIAALLAWLAARPDRPTPGRAGLWLIIGGGLGNLYDRLVYGCVVDFIDLAFVRFAVFNIADACICVGAALVVLGELIGERRRKGNAHGGI